nr:hypothetical protein [Tanacetum cinerariifolium]
MPRKHRKQRIRAPHERKFPNRVSRAVVEMTYHNSFKKGHNKSSCIKPTFIPPTKQPGKKGGPKKNNDESVGAATCRINNMDGSTSPVRQRSNATSDNVESRGDATGTNVESRGDATGTNMESRGDANRNELITQSIIGVETSERIDQRNDVF